MNIYIIASIFVMLMCIILILEIDNTSKLNKLYKLAKLRNSPIPDAKYFELKSSLNLIKILITVGVFLLGFIGFNSYSELKSHITDNINEEIDLYDSTMSKIYKHYDEQLSFMDSSSYMFDTLTKLNVERINITAELMESKHKVLDTTISMAISILNEIKRSNYNFSYFPFIYPITKLVIHEIDSATFRLYYKDLKTLNNDNLPKFNSNPLIIFENRIEQGIIISKKNNEYFEIKVNDYFSGNKEELLGLIIISYEGI